MQSVTSSPSVSPHTLPESGQPCVGEQLQPYVPTTSGQSSIQSAMLSPSASTEPSLKSTRIGAVGGVDARLDTRTSGAST